MDEEEQNGGQQSQGRGSRGGLGSKLNNVKDKAENIQKGAQNRSDMHKKKATQKGNKAKDLQAKAGQGGKGAAKAGQKAGKATKQAAKHAKKAEKMAKVAAKAGKVASAASKLAAIASTVGIVLIIIIAIIGILVFIIAGFGLIMKGLQDLVDGFMNYMESLWGGEENRVETDQIAEVLGYLQEMDYDLYGYGFVTKENALVDADEAVEKKLATKMGGEENLAKARRIKEVEGKNKEEIKKYGQENNWTEAQIKEAYTMADTDRESEIKKLDEKTTAAKDEVENDYGKSNGKVLAYKSGTEDFDEAYRYIIPYLVSDNYAKVIKNNNKNFKTAFSGVGTFFNGLFNNGTAWGSGLLSIYHEESVGKRGDAFGNSGMHEALNKAWIIPTPVTWIASAASNLVSTFEGDVDVTDDGYLVIKGSGTFSHDIMKYKIDGWIGRYGMPIEFLLATHIATMAPDVSLKLATEYSTDVEVLLHESENGTVKSAVKIDGTQITQEEIQKAWDEANGISVSSEACALAVLRNTKLESRPRNDNKVPKYKCEGPPNWEELSREESLNTYADNIMGSQIDGKIKGFFDEQGNLNNDSKVKVDNSKIDEIINQIKQDFLETDGSTSTAGSGSTGGETNNPSNADNNSNNNNHSKTITFQYNQNARGELTINGEKIKFGDNNETNKINYTGYTTDGTWESAAIPFIEEKLGLEQDKLMNNSEFKNWLKEIGEAYLNEGYVNTGIDPSKTVTISQETSRHRSVTSRSDTQTYKYKYSSEEKYSQSYEFDGTYNGEEWKFRFKIIVETIRIKPI